MSEYRENSLVNSTKLGRSTCGNNVTKHKQHKTAKWIVHDQEDQVAEITWLNINNNGMFSHFVYNSGV